MIEGSNENKNETSVETKICILCNPNRTVSKEHWFRHLNKTHFKGEFQAELCAKLEIDHSEKEKCSQCGFTGDESSMNVARHIVEEHGNEISEKLYANAIIKLTSGQTGSPSAGNVALMEQENFKVEAPEGEDQSTSDQGLITATQKDHQINSSTSRAEINDNNKTPEESFLNSQEMDMAVVNSYSLATNEQENNDEAIIEDNQSTSGKTKKLFCFHENFL